jgi:secretion/DNA translocation related TadE-like protein
VTTHRADRGSATVWLVAAIAVVIAATATALAMGIATLSRHRAAAAADAVALRVALDVIQGPTVACRAGAALAALDGAAVERCAVDGADATVEVTVRLPGPLAVLGPAVGRARAGPVSDLATG